MIPSPLSAALYLHGGPGLNAAIERMWFAEQTDVLWWDQPRFTNDAPAAFATTLAVAAEQLLRLSEAGKRPVHVIGWSFGTRLALELASRQPAAVSRLTLLAPTLILREAIPRLAQRLIAADVGGPELKAALRQAHALQNHEALLALSAAALAVPDLIDRYWSPNAHAACSRHRQLATQTQWFDMATFAAVSKDLFDRPLPARLPDGLPVRILAGRHDIYFDRERDEDTWRELFPHAEISVVEAGHMLPFERPADEWLRTP